MIDISAVCLQFLIKIQTVKFISFTECRQENTKQTSLERGLQAICDLITLMGALCFGKEMEPTYLTYKSA